MSSVSTAFAQEAGRIRRNAGVTTSQIARATGAAKSTVRDWLGLRSEPRGVRAERIVELSEIIDRLGRVMSTDYIPIWLNKPIEALGDAKPLDLISAGEYQRVARVVSAIEDPGAV
ncbi:MAG: DUF2384 domain-containing protein [bacterium]|nr:DUF2384 domain-containing protein [bacterium]